MSTAFGAGLDRCAANSAPKLMLLTIFGHGRHADSSLN
jgi:hypothetical protein